MFSNRATEVRRAAVKQAKAAGFYVHRGSYYGTTDDRADRWYVGCSGSFFRPFGAGYRTRREAWEAAVEHMQIIDRDSAE